MRRFLIPVVAVVVIVGLLLLMRATQPNGAASTISPLSYSVARAHYGNLNVSVSGSGTVQAGQSLDVEAQQSGTVASVGVIVGSQVRQGGVLAAVTDDGALEGDVTSAEAQLAADKASLAALYPTLATAAAITAQQERVQADKAVVARDEAQVADLTVDAPAAGEVASVDVVAGQVVSPGTELFEIVQPGSVEIEVSVPEIDLSNIYMGEGVQVWTQDQGTMQAAVTYIGLISSGQGSRGALYPVTLAIENPPSGLRQGMQATANFTEDYFSVPGTVAFTNPQQVVAQVSGTVTNLPVEAGNTVTSGETLLTLENQGLAPQLDSDQAALAADVSQLQQLLHPTQPTAAQVTSLRERIANDQAAVGRARLALGQLDITAPISGVVTAVNVQQGSLVAPGAATPPFTVEDPNSLQVLVPISEISIAQVALGQSAAVTADALPGETFHGTVGEIAPAGLTSQGVATFNVTVDVAHPGDLRAGMSADVSIRVASLRHVLLVPNEALSGYGRQATLQVVVHGTPKLRHVVMGLSNETDTEILSGLTAGTEVVTAQASTGTLPFGQSSSSGK